MIRVYGAQGPDGKMISRALLSAALQEEWGLSPCPPLVIAPGGKPQLQGCPQHHFNLSHSGEYALCALADSPVGVDIQVLRPFRDTLLTRTSSPRQREWLADFQNEPAAFALLWAMKESRCKYQGTGLTRPISHIRVPLPPEVSYPSKACRMSLDGLTFTLFSGPGWQACVCGTAGAEEPIRWLTADTADSLLPPRQL